ncbi:hypothetical protein [Oscillatoria sp. FACHB-1406]|uniref:hypothetical protein n=1 Tax=Oscillatoria sp. FACHB-1406 TaxID=2692846 RepID=UPI001A7E2125|nr:hypothetical protein [Oscillatoria sp. FACHB-1406]
MMTDKPNALDRIMNKRSRPAVPPRADIVNESVSQDVKTSLSQDIKTNRQQDINVDRPQDVNTNRLQDINIEIPKVVRSTTRIEESIDTAMRHLCADEKLTKEVWFEAAYLYLVEHPEAMGEVNAIARERLKQRKEAADLRRAQTMKEKLETRFSL